MCRVCFGERTVLYVLYSNPIPPQLDPPITKGICKIPCRAISLVKIYYTAINTVMHHLPLVYVATSEYFYFNKTHRDKKKQER